MLLMKHLPKIVFALLLAAIALGFNAFQEGSRTPTVPVAFAAKRNLIVTVKTVGELDAATSTTIASVLRGEACKIIALVPDGKDVKRGDLLVRLDPSPFEEKCEKLKLVVKEQKSKKEVLQRSLEWEIESAAHKQHIAELEVESAKLELAKLVHGEGPQEVSRLTQAMQKARLLHDETESYQNDLLQLQQEGILTPAEVKLAEKKHQESQETYVLAKQQYDAYVDHLLPMLIKKGEAQVKRQQLLYEELLKGNSYAIEKAKDLLAQAEEHLSEALWQLQEAERELAQTDIVATNDGMVVLREEYRGSQKRKPRVGDTALRNQPLIDLPDMSRMIVKTKVREVDLHKIDVGKRAVIEVDAYPQLTLQGEVISIGVLANNDLYRTNEEKYFDLILSVEGTEKRLRPGMTVQVTLLAARVEDALTIPIHSVFEEGRRSYCMLFGPKNSTEKREVETGHSDDQWIEITQGLSEGECVALIKL